jgi:hypothetical protein
MKANQADTAETGDVPLARRDNRNIAHQFLQRQQILVADHS